MVRSIGAWIPWIGWSKSPHNKTIEALIPLILKGEKNKIELQISRGADVNCRGRFDVIGQAGMHYPLHIAAKEGHKGIVDLLLKEGAEINAKDNYEGTALHLAARRGHKEVVKLLISEGAKINEKDTYLNTPVDYAEDISGTITSELKQSKLETAKLLRENKGKPAKELCALSEAIRCSNINEVIEHLDYGSDVNEMNEVDSTPLHFAAQRGDKEILELLITRGANLNEKNKYAHTPLDMSLDESITNILRKHGGKMGEKLKAIKK